VQAFRKPESRNANITMVAMGLMARALFSGITFLSIHLGLIPSHEESILSQMARRITGGGLLYYWVQLFTAMILFLAANTAYQGFPRLGSFLAKDNFLPRWMENRGDRLVFSSGIGVLGLISALLVIAFDANEIAMLPLYALGVMLTFFISRAGMSRLMGRIAHLQPGERIRTMVTKINYERGAQYKRLMNAVGALVTFIVFVILITTKFRERAWVVAVGVPLLIALFLSINRHYNRVATALSTNGLTGKDLTGVADVVIVPIADVHRGTLRAFKYAKRFSKHVRALCVGTSPEMKERLSRRWERFKDVTEGIELVLLDYDYRDILTPVIEYIEQVNNVEFPNKLTTVVIPEFVPEHKVAEALHNQTARRLHASLKN
jgi:amino acid transporter